MCTGLKCAVKRQVIPGLISLSTGVTENTSLKPEDNKTAQIQCMREYTCRCH